MPFRLQCDLCGAKSGPVESLPPGERERQMLAEFRALHDATCASNDVVNFPAGATSPELPAEVIAAAQVGPFGRAKRPPVSALRPHGRFEYTGPYGEKQVGDTLSCCHCRAHWQVRIGSGKTRGFCMRCNALTCGRPECDRCIPFEQRLDNLENGLPALTPAAPAAAVPCLAGIESEADDGPGALPAAMPGRDGAVPDVADAGQRHPLASVPPGDAGAVAEG